ncbi:hypothetical protein OESDEN_19913 [Oesophagostomum dentatum]|uniref:Uncharacterized protein n=1 Tax=Oesophagostomum dentatum TaxID=61180 RepID=A0A0B1SA40_OESDE|nr:hypothetical protein OESDEN_19913 [Oesophagostomum dentatum]
MVFWRVAGINYVRYSQIAAEVTRKCSKKAVAAAAAKTAKPDFLKKLRTGCGQEGGGVFSFSHVLVNPRDYSTCPCPAGFTLIRFKLAMFILPFFLHRIYRAAKVHLIIKKSPICLTMTLWENGKAAKKLQ